MNVKKTENLFECEFRLSKSSFQFLETTEASSHNKPITTNVSLVRQLPSPAAHWDRSPMLTASLLHPGPRGRLCVSAWPADRTLPRRGTAIPLLKQTGWFELGLQPCWQPALAPQAGGSHLCTQRGSLPRSCRDWKRSPSRRRTRAPPASLVGATSPGSNHFLGDYFIDKEKSIC